MISSHLSFTTSGSAESSGSEAIQNTLLRDSDSESLSRQLTLDLRLPETFNDPGVENFGGEFPGNFITAVSVFDWCRAIPASQSYSLKKMYFFLY